MLSGKQHLNITATAEFNKDHATIGERIKYTIEIRTNKEIDIRFPDLSKNLIDFTIKEFGSFKKGIFQRRYVQWYILDTYTIGRHSIPEATIQYKEKRWSQWQEIEINSVEIVIQSMLEKTGSYSDIKDIKGPCSPAHRFSFYILGVLFFIAIVIFCLWIFSKRNRLIKTPILQKSAHQRAYDALQELKRKDYIRQGKIKEYYVELSDILRHYLENRFNLRAPEMTTEEFLVKAKETKELTCIQKDILKKFLLHCDLVKFAKYGPDEAEINSSYESVRMFIEQTKIEIVEQPQTGTDIKEENKIK